MKKLRGYILIKADGTPYGKERPISDPPNLDVPVGTKARWYPKYEIEDDQRTGDEGQMDPWSDWGLVAGEWVRTRVLRDPTTAEMRERDNRTLNALDKLGSIDRAQFVTLFNQENRLLVLEGKDPLTAAEFRTLMRNRMR